MKTCKFASVTDLATDFRNHEAINTGFRQCSGIAIGFPYAATLPESGNFEYNARNCVEPLRITRHRQYCDSAEWCCGQSVVRIFSQAGNKFVLPPKKKKKKFPVAGARGGPPII